MAAGCGHLRLLRQSWAPTLVGATAGVHHHHPALAEGWHGGTGHMEANDSGRTPGCARCHRCWRMWRSTAWNDSSKPRTSEVDTSDRAFAVVPTTASA